MLTRYLPSFIWIFCGMFPVLSHSQSSDPVKCGSVINWKKLENDPVAYKAFMDKEAATARRIAENNVQLLSDTIYEIPVVFHIVLSVPCLVTDQMIQQQMDVLNRGFSGTDPRSANAPAFDNVRQKKPRFKFVLAKQNPHGFYTNGVTRTKSDLKLEFKNGGTINTTNKIKHKATGGVNQWNSPTHRYLNIWIGEMLDPLEGISSFPGNGPEDEQGIVMNVLALPINNPSYPDAIGIALVHEVGHYFNLIHIWADAAGCLTDDFVGDTPLQDVASNQLPCAAPGIVTDVCSPANPGINYQNYMDYNFPAFIDCLTMFTVGQTNRMVDAATTSRALLVTNNKALVPPVEKLQLFNTCNTPVFTSNLFKTIGVGKDGAVWAGTYGQGFYKYSFGEWKKFGSYLTNTFQTMQPDNAGGMWVAQSGNTGVQSNTGGLIHFPDSTFTNIFYSSSNGMPTRNVRGVFVDTSVKITPTQPPRIWLANYAHLTGGFSTSGGIARGFNATTPLFTTYRTGVDVNLNGGGVFYIGGNTSEIWTYANSNFGKSQILRHSAATGALLGAYDTTAGGMLGGLVPGQFIAKAIYFDAKGNKWISIQGVGMLVLNNMGVWKKVTFPEMFPPNAIFNNHAIAGDDQGNVYFGTSNGLIIYTGGKPIDALTSYAKLTQAEGLPHNNVTAICVDTLRGQLLVATDGGIAFGDVCRFNNTRSGATYSTTSAGTWGAAEVWCAGIVPTTINDVIVRHPIVITTDTEVNSITIIAPGSVTVSPGVNFTVRNQ